MTHPGYRVGMPGKGEWSEIFNSDAKSFWGSGVENNGYFATEKISWHGRENSILITIPPLAAVVFKKTVKVPAKYELKK